MDQQGHRIQCHYDVLSVARDADAATIKKAHRKMALQVRRLCLPEPETHMMKGSSLASVY